MRAAFCYRIILDESLSIDAALAGKKLALPPPARQPKKDTTMHEQSAPPQPGGPDDAARLLPLGKIGATLAAGAAFCALAAMLFVWLAHGALGDRYIHLDDGLILWLHARATPALSAAMLLLTTIGEPMVLGLLVALMALGLYLKHRWVDAAALVLAAAGGGVLNQLLKGLYQRVRPDLTPRTFDVAGYSFPSGHAMGAMVCYGMLAVVLWRLLRGTRLRPAVWPAATLIILGVGLSRVYFGVHFPTDILGGYLAGAIWLACCIVALRIATWRWEDRTTHREGAKAQREPIHHQDTKATRF
ncbi:phosphatase PAP2 family protein [Chloroflexia bacterium SDU3-3]|nr:phosphatase PAP2 family protein [Chloroflexia bacterium SDU3-3]